MPKNLLCRLIALVFTVLAAQGLATLGLSGRAAATEVRVAPNIYLVKDKPGTPLSFQMLVFAGCWDEAEAQCKGLAHYLEHLVLVGRNPEHKDAAVRMFATGYANGWTSARATVYVHAVPNGSTADLEQLFTFYAARLKDFAIPDAEAARERNVVLQEHDWRVGSKPNFLLARDLQRTLVPDHVAGQWTIGTKQSIEAMTLEQARAYHKAWYVLNNVAFVIKGDIDEATVKAISEKALAGLEPRALPRRNFFKPIEIVPGRQDIRRSHPTVQRASVIYRKLIRVPEPDLAVQRAERLLLMNYLSGELPGSLNHALRDAKNLAAGRPFIQLEQAAPQTYTLSIGAETAPDVSPEALLAAISAWVDALPANPVSAELLARLQSRFAANRANGDKDPKAVYNRLISWLTNRQKYEDQALWPARVAAVTPASVNAIVAAVAAPGRIVTGILEPEKKDGSR